MRAGSFLLALPAALLLPDPAVAETAAAAPFTLEQCRLAAAREHPTLAAARADAAAARARQAIAVSGFLPQLSADASYFAGRGTGGVSSGGGRGGSGVNASGPVTGVSTTIIGPADFESWGANLTLRQNLWDFGRTLNSTQAATAQTEAAIAQERLAREVVDVDAEITYRTAIAAEELVASFEAAAARARAQYELAKARAEVGLRPAYDVSRAEVEVASAEYALVQARNARDITRAELGNACGLGALPPGATLEAPPPRSIEVPGALEAKIEESIARLPEVEAARARAEAADQRLDLAWSAFLPALSATGTLGYRGTDLDNLGPGWSALVQLSIPIVSGGADLAGVRAARADLAAEEARVTETERAARLEAESAGSTLREAQARLAAAEKREKAAAEGLELAQARYTTGLGDALEVADAQAVLASAQADRVRSELDVSVAAIRLERLLGNWREP